jgi:hypothetical protein
MVWARRASLSFKTFQKGRPNLPWRRAGVDNQLELGRLLDWEETPRSK